MSFAYNAQRAAEFQRRRLNARAPLSTSSRRTYEQLRASIRAGLTETDTQFRELVISEQFGASRNSVRVALAMLAADGLISRGPRTGTKVTKQIVDFPIDRVLPRHFAPYPAAEKYGLVVVDVENAVLTTPPLIAELLQTDAPQIVSYVQLAVYDGDPLYVRSGIAPITFDADEYMNRLTTSSAEVTALMGQDGGAGAGSFEPEIEMEAVFERLFQTPFGYPRFRVEVVGADQNIAGLLGIEHGAPMLLRQQINYDIHDVGREFSFTHFRGDRATLTSHRSYGQGTL